MSWTADLDRIGRLARTVGRAEVIISELADFVRHPPTDRQLRNSRGNDLADRAELFLTEIGSAFAPAKPSENPTPAAK